MSGEAQSGEGSDAWFHLILLTFLAFMLGLLSSRHNELKDRVDALEKAIKVEAPK